MKALLLLPAYISSWCQMQTEMYSPSLGYLNVLCVSPYDFFFRTQHLMPNLKRK